MPVLNVAYRVDATRAEGPGLRAALWVAGCSIRCPGCCNPELFSARAGAACCASQLATWIRAVRDNTPIEGVSVLGGEPLEQWPALAPWLMWVKAQGLGVVVFSGFAWSEILTRVGLSCLSQCVDTIVEGPYQRQNPEPAGGRAMVGSSNQQLRHLSPRYANPELWTGPARAQIDPLPGGAVRIHGAPRLVAKLKSKLKPDTRAV